MWKPSGDEWLSAGNAHVASPVSCLNWGQDMLAVGTLSSLYLLQEHPLSAFYSRKVCKRFREKFVIYKFSRSDVFKKQEVLLGYGLAR